MTWLASHVSKTTVEALGNGLEGNEESGALVGTVEIISGCNCPGGSVEMNPTSIHRDVGLIPGPLSGLMIQCCRELWCGLQTWLRSGIAVAVA